MDIENIIILPKSNGDFRAPEQISENFQLNNFTVLSVPGRANEDRYSINIINGEIQYFGLFDGHGNANGNDPKHIVDRAKNLLSEYIVDGLDDFNNWDNNKIMKFMLTKVFTKFDEDSFKLDFKYGTTANVVLIYKDDIYQVNLGDSRSVIFNDEGKIISETKDHKPDNEIKSIEENGGFVLCNKVNGRLAVSRAFGDWILKPIISNKPDIIITKKVANSYIIIGSDGLFEGFLSSQNLVNFVNNKLNEGINMKDIVGLATERAKLLTNDDITIILIKL